jgi:hypothetical protein
MFTCKREKLAKSGLDEIIGQVLVLDRLGSVVLEELFQSPIRKLNSLEKDRPSRREGNSLRTRQVAHRGASKFLGSDLSTRNVLQGEERWR